MAGARGRQYTLAMSLENSPVEGLRQRTTRDRFSKLAVLWIPRRFLLPDDADLSSFLKNTNDLINRRGFILYDGQILTKSISESDVIDLIFEGDTPYECPEPRDWGPAQRKYFGLADPYQMGEESEEYTYSHALVRVIGSYLDEGELIAAVLHGERDAYYFYCGCHCADVVYTTRNRLICMACGAMHAVLRSPLDIAPKVVLADDEWADLFDEDGSRREEEIELSVLDFQDVEPAETIWTTEQWEDAKHEFIFFARSSPEEIAYAIRGTERDQSIFFEAGWTPMDLPPPPAHQVAAYSVSVALLTNAALALEEGVAAYVRARNDPDRLVTAVLQLFRAVELVLKAKLEDANPEGLKDHPNNPVVLERLAAGGVALLPDERATVTQTRRLRNELQHGTAQLNFRNGLNTCRNTVAFLDRFVEEELGLWIADTINADDWWQLLNIPSVAARASKVAGQRIEDMRNSPNVQIVSCPRCKQFALVRPHPATGHACVYCNYVPAHQD